MTTTQASVGGIALPRLPKVAKNGCRNWCLCCGKLTLRTMRTRNNWICDECAVLKCDPRSRIPVARCGRQFTRTMIHAIQTEPGGAPRLHVSLDALTHEDGWRIEDGVYAETLIGEIVRASTGSSDPSIYLGLTAGGWLIEKGHADLEAQISHLPLEIALSRWLDAQHSTFNNPGTYMLYPSENSEPPYSYSLRAMAESTAAAWLHPHALSLEVLQGRLAWTWQATVEIADPEFPEDEREIQVRMRASELRAIGRHIEALEALHEQKPFSGKRHAALTLLQAGHTNTRTLVSELLNA